MTTTISGSTGIVTPALESNTPVKDNAPAFSAYQSVAQSLVSAVVTKLQFQTEEFDTANAFDSTTNYRFTPQVAGYYQVNGGLQMSGAATNSLFIAVHKNGSEYKRGVQHAANLQESIVTALVYLNGSTDYIELFGANVGTTQNTFAGLVLTYFQAYLVRAA